MKKKLQYEDAVDYYLDIPNEGTADHLSNEGGGNNDLQQFLNKPFYCGNTELKGIHDCCFNHLIGLPKKKGQEHPIYDYEMEIFDAIENNQHLWCKKARGIGFTTFMIRYLAWKCLVDDSLAGQSIFITTGTEKGFAMELKEKVEDLFYIKYPRLKLESRYDQLILNKTRFKTFPTKTLKDMRGYTDVAYIFIDEADYFEKKQQEEIGAVIRSYEEKSDCKIIMVSTPNRPDGLFYAIETNQQFKGFFKKIEMLYERGLDRIFDRDQIEHIKQDNPEFEREYNGKYIGKAGNVWTQAQIESVLKLGGEPWPPHVNQKTFHPVGVDFGFNISKTVICIGEWDRSVGPKGTLRIVRMDDFGDEPPTPEEVSNRLHEIKVEYGTNTHFFIDGSNRGMVNQIKKKMGEPIIGWEKEEFNKRYNVHPISFGVHKMHQNLLSNMYHLTTMGMLAIPRKYDKLVISMRTAVMQDWDLDKDETVNNDYLDACRLMCWGIQLQ